MRLLGIVVAAVAAVVAAIPATAQSLDCVRVVNDRAPDCPSLAAIVQSVTKDCKTDDDRVIAIYNFCRYDHYHHAYPSEPGGISALKLINVYGWSLCGGEHRCMRRNRSSTARPRVRAAGDLDYAVPVRIAAQLVGQRPGGGRFADAAGAGEDEGVGVRGSGEGGEAADDGGLAVDVGEAGGAVAGEEGTPKKGLAADLCWLEFAKSCILASGNVSST